MRNKTTKTFLVFLALNCMGIVLYGQKKVQKILDQSNSIQTNGSGVEEIDFGKCKLTTLPSEVLKFNHLRKLSFRKNRLQVLPEELYLLTRLEELDLSCNDFAVVPNVICELKNLKKLILNNNPLDSLPSCLENLQRLELLDLWGTNILELPAGLSTIEGLHIDMQLIAMNRAEQKALLEKFPKSNFEFSQPCNCRE